MGFGKASTQAAGTDTPTEIFLPVDDLTLISASLIPDPDTDSFGEIWAQIFLITREGPSVINQALLMQGYVDQINGLHWTGNMRLGATAEVMGRIYSQSTATFAITTLTEER